MKYLTDLITTEKLKEWIEQRMDVLLIANAGAGKTYLLLEQFVQQAKENDLNVLYCYNRKSMKEQFAQDYADKHDNLSIISYQKLQQEDLFSKDEMYLNEYDVILCDECQYFVSDAWTKETYISFEKIQRNNAQKIYFTATPEPFEAIAHLVHKPFKTLDMRPYTAQNIDEIYIAKETKTFEQAEENFLRNNTVIHFEDNKNHNQKLATKYENQGYTTAVIDKRTNNDVTKKIASTDQDQNIFVNFLATTSTNETGVNFNIVGDSVVTFQLCIDYTGLIQSAARLRKFEGNKNNTVKMLFKTTHKNILRNAKEMNDKRLEELLTARKTLLEGSEIVPSIIRYDFEISYLQMQNSIIEEMQNFKDETGENNLIKFYELKLAELFPSATIKPIDKYDVLPIEEVLNDLLGNDNEMVLDKDMQLLVKDILGIGIKVMKEKMKYKFDFVTKRQTTNGIKETLWIIKRKINKNIKFSDNLGYKVG